MKAIIIKHFAFLIGILFVPFVAGQPNQMPLANLGQNTYLPRMFGENKAFTAKAESVQSGRNSVSLGMGMAMLDGKIRMEVDMASAKGKDFSAENAAMMKQMGMDRMVIISIPAQQISRFIFPGLESYTEMTATQSAGSADAKMEVKELGKETIDGHPCVKNQVTFTDASGASEKAVTWNATDLKQFPIKIEFSNPNEKTVMTFKDVKLSAPDAKLFSAPANYAKYGDFQQMMFAAMQKKFKP